MKITKRIAEEAYCYTEIEFSSLEEYQTQYPIFSEAMKDMKRKLSGVQQSAEEYLNENLPGFKEQPKVQPRTISYTKRK
jgi:hypothetical protein